MVPSLLHFQVSTRIRNPKLLRIPGMRLESYSGPISDAFAAHTCRYWFLETVLSAIDGIRVAIPNLHNSEYIALQIFKCS